ncbi:MAG: hypothetical protein H6708_22415 [Kofleriaceae bacterium]|nr:hypothetical protein [Kofleriaceae bacterium]
MGDVVARVSKRMDELSSGLDGGVAAWVDGLLDHLQDGGMEAFNEAVDEVVVPEVDEAYRLEDLLNRLSAGVDQGSWEAVGERMIEMERADCRR